MNDPAERRRMTLEAYRALERGSATKHEYVDGEVFAMAGAKHAHNRVSANVLTALTIAFGDRPCEANGSDMRVMAGNSTLHYPDVSMLCGEPRFSDDREDELVNPSAIVEVLSESTEAYDRGEKFEHYQTIESLQEYVLVDPRRLHVDVYARESDGWKRRSYGAGQVFRLGAVHVEIAVDDLYKRVRLPA
ncbi:MAG: Uma2 family endonuclease [Myxococcota bacterium]